MEQRLTATAAHSRRNMNGTNPFKLGFFCQNASSGRFITCVEERWSASWDDNLRAAQLADAAGFDFLLPIGRWKGYGGRTDFQGASFETLTWATGLLAATERICVFGTVHVPLFHPLLAAKQMVTADHVGHGRFALNIVAGWNEGEFQMFGIAQKDHAGRYDQAQEWIDIVKRAWTEDDFDVRGRFYELTGVREKPKPYGGTRPLIMNAGISEDGRAFALRNCDALFTATNYGFTDEELARARADVADLKARARAQGREIDVYTNGSLLCRPTAKEAHEYHQYLCVEHADWEVIDTMVGMRYNLAEMSAEQRDAFRRRFATIAGGFALIGSPDELADKLATIASCGFAGIALTSPHYVDEFRYYPEEILPRLERSGLRTPLTAARGGMV